VIHYKADVLDELRRHGLRPAPDTTPDRLRDQIHALYLYEIRKLRDRCRAGEFPSSDLAGRVVELRKRYMLLSIPLHLWMEQDERR
jgi:hypothetical protein